TDLSPSRRANPILGAKLFLSVRTRPRPISSPDWLAVTTGSKVRILVSKNGRVLSEGTMNRPFTPVVGSTYLGSKLVSRSLFSINGVTTSYRKPRFNVRLGVTFQSSWQKYPCSQL